MTDMFDLFVYGLLMPGQSGYDELGLADRTQRLGPDRVMGRLYDLGDYPGLVADGSGVVHGEILRSNDASLLAELDAYELYDPEDLDRSDYRRVRIVTLDRAPPAWTYIYLRPLNECPIIETGDWRNR